jgi:hypothetical protein
MPWDDENANAATQLVNVQAEQIFDRQPEPPDADSVVHCQVTVAFAPVGIGGAIVSVYGATNGAEFDTQPLDRFILSRQEDPNRISFTVSGVRKFRVGVQSSGTLGTLASADLSFRVGSAPPPPG